MTNIIIKQYIVRRKNARVFIECITNGEKIAYRVITRKLIDFKTREILETNNIYSGETLIVLHDLIGDFIINDKLLVKTIAKEKIFISEWKNKEYYDSTRQSD